LADVSVNHSSTRRAVKSIVHQGRGQCLISCSWYRRRTTVLSLGGLTGLGRSRAPSPRSTPTLLPRYSALGCLRGQWPASRCGERLDAGLEAAWRRRPGLFVDRSYVSNSVLGPAPYCACHYRCAPRLRPHIRSASLAGFK